VQSHISPEGTASKSSPDISLLFDSPKSKSCLLLSSGIAGLSTPGLQFSPQADHVLRGLVMRGVVAIEATRLVKPEVVQILHMPASSVEFLDPHAHAHSSILNSCINQKTHILL
jgi:hypothetical protein